MDIRAGYSRSHRAEAVVSQAIPSDVLMGLPGMVMDRLLRMFLKDVLDILEIRMYNIVLDLKIPLDRIVGKNIRNWNFLDCVIG